MNCNTYATRLSPTESAALMQAARLRAVQLRRQAIDDTWQALVSAIRHALHLKSGQRAHHALEG